MNKFSVLSVACASSVALLSWSSPAAQAQHFHGHGHHHSHGHNYGHGYRHIDVHVGHHSGHHHVLRHYDHHYHGTYWVDSGAYYYQPGTFAGVSGMHVTAKPTVVEFGSYSHIDDLSGRLERLANELCLDMHYNYSHNQGYAETYSEAYQILDMAKYIHASEHQNDRPEIARSVQDLDPLFHHVQDDIRNWSRHHHRQIGQAGIVAKTETMEALLHHLMNDVGIRPHAATTSPVEVAPPPITDAKATPPSPTVVTSPPPLTVQSPNRTQ